MDIFSLLATLFLELREFWAESLLVDLVKFFLLVYCLVLVVNVALLVYLQDVPKTLRQVITGNQLPLTPKSKAQKRWQAITARLEAGSVSQYKVALLEADTFVSEVLRSMGYSGENMQEQLEHIEDGKVATKETLLVAHQMRNRIIHEDDLTLDRKEAETWLEHYKKFLEEVELLA